MKKFNFKKRFRESSWMQLGAAICVGVVLYLFLAHIGLIISAVGSFLSLISPVIYGAVLAYLISPLVAFIERRILRRIRRDGLRHQLANCLAIITVIVLFVILMSFLIPQLIDSIVLFINNINAYAETLSGTLRSIADFGREHNLDMSVLDSYTTGFVSEIVRLVSGNASRIAQGSLRLTGNALNLGLGLILTVYFLVYKNVIIRQYHELLSSLLPQKKYIEVARFISQCNRIMATYVVSDILDAVIIGILNAVYMALTGTPYLVLISVVVAVLNLLPTFGPFVGAGIAGLILLFADAHAVLPFLLFTLVLQLIDGYIIKPRLFAGALGVPGVWITVGIIVGGKCFGFIGVLLAAPTVAILAFIIEKELSQARLRREDD